MTARCVLAGTAGNGDYNSTNTGKVGCKCNTGTRFIACGLATNLNDYLYGGGEGKIGTGCLGLRILRGKFVSGSKIRKKNKLLNKSTARRCDGKVPLKQQGGPSTLCLSKKGFPVDVSPSKKADVPNVVNDKLATKIRLCCLITPLLPAGYITVAYDGRKYALAHAIEDTAGYKSGEPAVIRIHRGYGKDEKKLGACQHPIPHLARRS